MSDAQLLFLIFVIGTAATLYGTVSSFRRRRGPPTS
jgi:hypothetical protein